MLAPDEAPIDALLKTDSGADVVFQWCFSRGRVAAPLLID